MDTFLTELSVSLRRILVLVQVGFTFEWRNLKISVVASQSNSAGSGDQVDTESVANHYKVISAFGLERETRFQQTDGTIGMNVSSGGNSTGANQAGISNTASGMVGGTRMIDTISL